MRGRRRNKRRLKKIRPYKNMFIVKVPTSETFDFVDDLDPDAPASVKDNLDALKITFLGQVAGTTENAGRILVMGLGFCNRGDLQSLIATHSLGWTIAAFEGRNIVQNRLLSHLLPDVDEDGNETPITDCTNRLTVIAGHKWAY